MIQGRTAVGRLTSPGKRVHYENRLAVAHYARYLYHPLVLVAPAVAAVTCNIDLNHLNANVHQGFAGSTRGEREAGAKFVEGV